MALLIDTLPLLCRSKKAVLDFFAGCGVGEAVVAELAARVASDHISKYAIARSVLIQLNENGDKTLRTRREVIRRVVEFDDYSACWPDDQLKAKGLVAELQRLVNIKDSFTRMANERESEAAQRRERARREAMELTRHREEANAVRRRLFALFGEPDPHRRGIALEGVLNDLFRANGILVREAFVRRDADSGGALEQVDGVIGLDGQLYLAEMKWWNAPLGPGEVSQHMVRVFQREQVRGIIISASGFTAAAIDTCRGALSRMVVTMCTVEEVVALLESDRSLADFLRAKVQGAIVDRNPFADVMAS